MMRALACLLACFMFGTGAMAASAMRDSVALPGGTRLEYYVSAPPGAALPAILVVVHGYSRDATRSFDAALRAATAAGQAGDTLIVAPLFQVSAARAVKCHFHGVPAALPGDALWNCGDWSDGASATNAPVTSFQAMDRLLAALRVRDPASHVITVAGFSAGGQFVQHYIGFARPPADVAMRYVVSDPSAFLYFDPVRPIAGIAGCTTYNDWKFGLDHLPPDLGRDGQAARAAYAAANISYLEGAEDTGTGPGSAYRLLETNCAAALQGPFRLQRGEAYAAYDKAKLAHGAHGLTIVPGCGHAVDCVFASPAARKALLGN